MNGNMNFEQLMQNPYFMMGAQMMAANQGKGMAPGAAFGQAAMGTADQLARTRKQAAKRSREEKAMDITERRLAETTRANLEREKQAAAKAQMYQQRPEALPGAPGKYWTPSHGVQGGSIDPMTMMMMMQGGGMGFPMGGGAPGADSDTAKRERLKSMEWGSGEKPSATTGGAPMPDLPEATPAMRPDSQGQPMGRMGIVPPGGGMPAPAAPPIAQPSPQGASPIVDKYSPQALSRMPPMQLRMMSLQPGLTPQQRFQIQRAMGGMQTVPMQ